MLLCEFLVSSYLIWSSRCSQMWPYYKKNAAWNEIRNLRIRVLSSGKSSDPLPPPPNMRGGTTFYITIRYWAVSSKGGGLYVTWLRRMHIFVAGESCLKMFRRKPVTKTGKTTRRVLTCCDTITSTNFGEIICVFLTWPSARHAIC
jgi:hypothetical protein